MTPDDAQRFLTVLGVERVQVGVPTPNGEVWLRGSCPLAPWTHPNRSDSKPSFAIRAGGSDDGVYNCFTCGGGDLVSLVRTLRGYRAPIDYKLAMRLALAEGDDVITLNIRDYDAAGSHEAAPITPFPEDWLESFPSVDRFKQARAYLRSRGVHYSTATALDLRFDTSREAIAFPIRDWTGVLVGLHGRRIDPQDGEPKYHRYLYRRRSNSLPWYGEHWFKSARPVVVVESVFDVAAVRPVWSNVVAPLSGMLSQAKVRRVASRFREVVLLLDADQVGSEAERRLRRWLPDAIIETAELPRGCKDPGEASPEQIHEALRDTVLLRGSWSRRKTNLTARSV